MSIRSLPASSSPSRLTAAILALTIALLSPAAQVRSEAQGPASTEEKPLPSGGTTVLAADTPAALVGAGVQLGKRGKVEQVDVTGMPFKTALRVSTDDLQDVRWSIQLQAPLPAKLSAGDVIAVEFYARSTRSMTGESSSEMVVEKGSEPYDKLIEFPFSVGNEWKRYTVAFKCSGAFDAGQTQLAFRGGYDRQAFEIGGVRVINYGTSVSLSDLPRTRFTYQGREANAPWRADAAARIDRYRKADLTITLTDASGALRPSVTVEVRQTRSAFRWGTAVVAEQLNAQDADGEKYRSTLTRLFNSAVFENDMKWPALVDATPDDRANLDKAMGFLLANGMTVRGHTLIWPAWQWMPKVVRQWETDPATLRNAVQDHVRKTTARFKGRVTEWDVVNEPYNNTDLQRVVGNAIVADAFRWAHESDPAARLYINDFGIIESGAAADENHFASYENTIRSLLADNVPLQGIGIQGHFGWNLTPPAKVLAALDRLAAFKLPLQVTELDIDISDEELRRDYQRDLLTVLLSHPSIEGVTFWGFWSRRHWRPNAAMFDEQWNPRPHGTDLVKLLTSEWTTHQTLTTDAAGKVRLRGFLGSYVITAQGQKQNAELRREGAAVQLKLEK